MYREVFTQCLSILEGWTIKKRIMEKLGQTCFHVEACKYRNIDDSRDVRAFAPICLTH